MVDGSFAARLQARKALEERLASVRAPRSAARPPPPRDVPPRRTTRSFYYLLRPVAPVRTRGDPPAQRVVLR